MAKTRIGPLKDDATFFLTRRLLTNPSEIKEPYRQHAWVYAAVNARAQALVSAPYQVMTGDLNDPNEDGKPVSRNHPWQRPFDRPNPMLASSQLIEGTEIFMCLRGEAFWLFTSELDGTYTPGNPPREIWFLEPDCMEEEVKNGVIIGWWYVTGGQRIAIPVHRVAHFKLFNPYNRYRGLSPLSAAMLGIRIDHKSASFSEALMDNGADPGGVLTSDVDLGEEQITALRQEWNAMHQGAMNRGKVAVLSGGVQYKQLEISAKEMEFLEQRRWTREEILAVFQVPKQAVGLIDDVNRATASVVKREWWQNVLVPRLKYNWQILYLSLFVHVDGMWVMSDLSKVEALQQDFNEKLDQAKKMKELGYGLNAINERLELGMEDVPWGDEPLTNEGQVPIMFLYENPGGVQEEDDEAIDVDAEVVEEDKEPKKKPKPEKKLKKALTHEQWIARELREFWHPSEATFRESWNQYLGRMRSRVTGRIDTWEFSASRTGFNELLPNARVWTGTARAEVNPALYSTTRNTLGRLRQELGGFSHISPSYRDLWIQQEQARSRVRFTSLSARDRNKLLDHLLHSAEDGRINDASSARSAINDWFDKQQSGRSKVIARTETGQLSNSLRYRAMRVEGVKRHTWITQADDLVRPTGEEKPGVPNHRRLHGVTRRVGSKFPNGLLYPMQRGAKKGEVIGCRCMARPEK